MKKNDITFNSLVNDLSVYINISTGVIFVVSLLIHIFIYHKYIEFEKKNTDIEMRSSLNIYTSNLLSQVEIIASSTIFIEFLRSGSVTRHKTENDFVELMSRMPRNYIESWNIVNSKGKLIFSFGEKTNNKIKLHLCYMGDILNYEHGNCFGYLDLYLTDNSIFKHLKAIHSDIEYCIKCDSFKQMRNIKSTVFNPEYDFQIRVVINPQSRFLLFLSFEIVLIFSLISISYWVRSKVKQVLIQKIINPINADSFDPKSTVKEIIEISYRKNLLQAKTIAEEYQKRRLANEIHDVFGSFLLSLKWDIEKLEKKELKDDYKKIVSSLFVNVNNLIDLTNNFIESLRPEILDTLGLKKSIELLVNEWIDKNTQCIYKYNLIFDDKKIIEAISHAIYRIVQEALNNIAKHSNATQSYIEIKENSSHIFMVIKDNGIGLNQNIIFEQKKFGHGLYSMKDRAISLGGTFSINSMEGNTMINISFPKGDYNN